MNFYYFASFSDLSRISPFDQFLQVRHDSATIYCDSVSKANWTFNGGYTLPSRATVKENRLIIPKIYFNTIGYYECTGTNEIGDTFKAISFLWTSSMFNICIIHH